MKDPQTADSAPPTTCNSRAKDENYCVIEPAICVNDCDCY